MPIGQVRMRFEPQRASLEHRINTNLPPPRSLIAVLVNLAMVSSTQRHGELIADLSAECPALRKAQVMGIAGLAPANQTRLLGHMSDVIAVANPARLRQCQHTFVDHLRSLPVLRLRRRRALSSRGLLPCPLRLIGLGRRKADQSCLEALLHGLRVGCRQFVLFDERPMRPDCSIIAAGKIAEFSDKARRAPPEIWQNEAKFPAAVIAV
jgi:hypothetical protein